MNTTLSYQDLAVAMLKCEQTQGQSVYQHGLSVSQHYRELIEENLNPSGWRIPSFFSEYKDHILANLHPIEVASTYLLYHDCGKPFCREVDENGKVHFPNHAEVSKKVFLEASGDSLVADLIGYDMILHTASSEEIQKLCETEWTAKTACTLLLAALSEIHSNAKMFGGIDSTSFKCKWKTIERRGKQICKHFFKENDNV